MGDDIAVVPATPDRWDDLEALFGPNGAYSNCWCLWWRLTNREHADNGPDGNRAALRTLVEDGREPGLLAYAGGTPVGWVSVAPRPEFGRVVRSPLFRPDDSDDAGCWSVVCFYVPRAHRGRGLTDVLLAGAVEHARAGGGTSIEGYAIVGDDLAPPVAVPRPGVHVRACRLHAGRGPVAAAPADAAHAVTWQRPARRGQVTTDEPRGRPGRTQPRPG